MSLKVLSEATRELENFWEKEVCSERLECFRWKLILKEKFLDLEELFVFPRLRVDLGILLGMLDLGVAMFSLLSTLRY